MTMQGKDWNKEVGTWRDERPGRRDERYVENVERLDFYKKFADQREILDDEIWGRNEEEIAAAYQEAGLLVLSDLKGKNLTKRPIKKDETLYTILKKYFEGIGGNARSEVLSAFPYMMKQKEVDGGAFNIDHVEEGGTVEIRDGKLTLAGRDGKVYAKDIKIKPSGVSDQQSEVRRVESEEAAVVEAEVATSETEDAEDRAEDSVGDATGVVEASAEGEEAAVPDTTVVSEAAAEDATEDTTGVVTSDAEDATEDVTDVVAPTVEVDAEEAAPTVAADAVEDVVAAAEDATVVSDGADVAEDAAEDATVVSDGEDVAEDTEEDASVVSDVEDVAEDAEDTPETPDGAEILRSGGFELVPHYEDDVRHDVYCFDAEPHNVSEAASLAEEGIVSRLYEAFSQDFSNRFAEYDPDIWASGNTVTISVNIDGKEFKYVTTIHVRRTHVDVDERFLFPVFFDLKIFEGGVEIPNQPPKYYPLATENGLYADFVNNTYNNITETIARERAARPGDFEGEEEDEAEEASADAQEEAPAESQEAATLTTGEAIPNGWERCERDFSGMPNDIEERIVEKDGKYGYLSQNGNVYIAIISEGGTSSQFQMSIISNEPIARIGRLELFEKGLVAFFNSSVEDVEGKIRDDLYRNRERRKQELNYFLFLKAELGAETMRIDPEYQDGFQYKYNGEWCVLRFGVNGHTFEIYIGDQKFVFDGDVAELSGELSRAEDPVGMFNGLIEEQLREEEVPSVNLEALRRGEFEFEKYNDRYCFAAEGDSSTHASQLDAAEIGMARRLQEAFRQELPGYDIQVAKDVVVISFTANGQEHKYRIEFVVDENLAEGSDSLYKVYFRFQIFVDEFVREDISRAFVDITDGRGFYGEIATLIGKIVRTNFEAEKEEESQSQPEEIADVRPGEELLEETTEPMTPTQEIVPEPAEPAVPEVAEPPHEGIDIFTEDVPEGFTGYMVNGVKYIVLTAGDGVMDMNDSHIDLMQINNRHQAEGRWVWPTEEDLGNLSQLRSEQSGVPQSIWLNEKTRQSVSVPDESSPSGRRYDDEYRILDLGAGSAGLGFAGDPRGVVFRFAPPRTEVIPTGDELDARLEQMHQRRVDARAESRENRLAELPGLEGRLDDLIESLVLPEDFIIREISMSADIENRTVRLTFNTSNKPRSGKVLENFIEFPSVLDDQYVGMVEGEMIVPVLHRILRADSGYQNRFENFITSIARETQKGRSAESIEWGVDEGSYAPRIIEVTSPSTPKGYKDFELEGRMYRILPDLNVGPGPSSFNSAVEELSFMTPVDGKEWRFPKRDDLGEIVRVFNLLGEDRNFKYWTDEEFSVQDALNLSYHHVICPASGEIMPISDASAALTVFILE